MTTNVVPLYPDGGAVDIVASLRRLADEIEAGEHPDLRFVVLVAVHDSADFVTYGFGPLSHLEAIGALARAVANDLIQT